MAARVIVLEGTRLSDALLEFRRSVDLCYRRSWYKRRFGYYEKSSVRQRRKKRLQQRNRRSYQRDGGRVSMYMGLKRLHMREGGFL